VRGETHSCAAEPSSYILPSRSSYLRVDTFCLFEYRKFNRNRNLLFSEKIFSFFLLNFLYQIPPSLPPLSSPLLPPSAFSPPPLFLPSPSSSLFSPPLLFLPQASPSPFPGHLVWGTYGGISLFRGLGKRERGREGEREKEHSAVFYCNKRIQRPLAAPLNIQRRRGRRLDKRGQTREGVSRNARHESQHESTANLNIEFNKTEG